MQLKETIHVVAPFNAGRPLNAVRETPRLGMGVWLTVHDTDQPRVLWIIIKRLTPPPTLLNVQTPIKKIGLN
jgi:hypothetical protein